MQLRTHKGKILLVGCLSKPFFYAFAIKTCRSSKKPPLLLPINLLPAKILFVFLGTYFTFTEDRICLGLLRHFPLISLQIVSLLTTFQDSPLLRYFLLETSPISKLWRLVGPVNVSFISMFGEGGTNQRDCSNTGKEATNKGESDIHQVQASGTM